MLCRSASVFSRYTGVPDCSPDWCIPRIPGGGFSAVLLAPSGGLGVDGHIPSAVIDIEERLFQIHGPQSGDLRTHAYHDVGIIGRLVLNIYDQEPPASKLARRALDLIDEMIMARTYGLEERMARLDR